MQTQNTADIQVLPLQPEEVLSHLLDQPPELVGEVLQWLDLRDLLSLRITNHRLHDLVHHHEKSISARLSTRLRCQNTAFQLPVKIHGLTTDLLFYIELHRRYSTVEDLSNLLCTHIVSRIQIQHPHPEKQVAEEWRLRKVARLHQRLFPALFLFNNFLECLHAVYLSGEEAFAQWDDDLLLLLHDVYDLDQQRIIEDFSPCDETTITNVTVASAILLGVAKSRKLSLSSKSPRYPFASLKRILISSGLLPMADLLNPDHNDSDRFEMLIPASDGIWKGKGRRAVKYTTPRLRSIHHLETQRVQFLGELPTHRGHKAKNRFAERQDLWDKAAFAVFQRLGCTGSFPPDTNQWIRCAMAEAYDAVYILADWQLPDPT